MSRPYLSVGAPPGEAGQHAVFAARVRHWPYDRLADHVWVDHDDEFKIQLQLLERQLRFITALHPGAAALGRGQRLTLDLRYVHRPDAPQVEAVLLGKAYDPADAEAARAAALALWELAASVMPVGYDLMPAVTAADFRTWSGEDVIRRASADRHWAAIRRPAEFLLWTDEKVARRYLPIVFPYRWEPSGWDVVWAALGRQSTPALISVSLRPEVFSEAEERVLSDLIQDLQELAGQARPPLASHAREAADWYERYVRGLRTAYAVHVTVLGAPALRWAVRSALSGPAWSLEEGITGGHAVQAEVVEPAEAEWPVAEDNLRYLEQGSWGASPWGQAKLLPVLERLQHLVDPSGALCAFRLPLLPPKGLPGVVIGDTISLSVPDSAAPMP